MLNFSCDKVRTVCPRELHIFKKTNIPLMKIENLQKILYCYFKTIFDLYKETVWVQTHFTAALLPSISIFNTKMFTITYYHIIIM